MLDRSVNRIGALTQLFNMETLSGDLDRFEARGNNNNNSICVVVLGHI